MTEQIEAIKDMWDEEAQAYAKATQSRDKTQRLKNCDFLLDAYAELIEFGQIV